MIGQKLKYHLRGFVANAEIKENFYIKNIKEGDTINIINKTMNCVKISGETILKFVLSSVKTII